MGAIDDLKIGEYTFSSNFDSGNLSSVEKIGELEFMFRISPDCEGTRFENRNRTWFYFSVKGGRQGTEIHFTIENMNMQTKLFSNDMRPIFRCVPSLPKWERLKTRCTYETGEDFLKVKFRHIFTHSHETTYFAFTYPYEYERLQQKIESLTCDEHCGVFVHHSVLTRSLESRSIDLITVSDFEGLEWDNSLWSETQIDGLFPAREGSHPCFPPTKRVVFISARVHPGETPSSHVMEGFWDFIMNKADPRARLLRSMFVFKIVPMLNPDGVVRGHYRTDTNGENLNRFYTEPDPSKHPTIWAVKKLMLHYHSLGSLAFYLDLHAHATRRGCFIYGNNLEDETQHTNNVLFARLMSINSQHFDFEGCNFSEKNMSAKDKRDGLSKEGAGRVAIYSATGITHCYTMECNYNIGRVLNTLVDASCPPDERSNLVQPISFSYVPKYTPECYAEVGVGIALSILDLFCPSQSPNPYSRLPNTLFRNLENLFSHVRASLFGPTEGYVPLSARGRRGANSASLTLQNAKSKSSASVTKSLSKMTVSTTTTTTQSTSSLTKLQQNSARPSRAAQPPLQSPIAARRGTELCQSAEKAARKSGNVFPSFSPSGGGGDLVSPTSQSHFVTPASTAAAAAPSEKSVGQRLTTSGGSNISRGSSTTFSPSNQNQVVLTLHESSSSSVDMHILQSSVETTERISTDSNRPRGEGSTASGKSQSAQILVGTRISKSLMRQSSTKNPADEKLLGAGACIDTFVGEKSKSSGSGKSAVERHEEFLKEQQSKHKKKNTATKPTPPSSNPSSRPTSRGTTRLRHAASESSLGHVSDSKSGSSNPPSRSTSSSVRRIVAASSSRGASPDSEFPPI